MPRLHARCRHQGRIAVRICIANGKLRQQKGVANQNERFTMTIYCEERMLARSLRSQLSMFLTKES